MKIIIIGTAFPLRGGIAHFNALLSKYLSKQHDVETITFKRQYPKILFPGKTQEENFQMEGIQPAPQMIDSINPYNWFKVAYKIREKRPDLLIFKYWLPFFGPCFGTIARRVKKNSGTKVLFICDNVIPHEKRPGDILFTKFAFKYVDYFIVQSKSVEKELLNIVPNANYSFSPHPLYEYFGKPLEKKNARENLRIKEEKVILFFGYIRPYKGLSVLIDAMKILKDYESQMGKVNLLAVGEAYEDISTYKDKIQKYGLSSNIQIISDYIPNHLVATYFSAADVVVLPYLSATQSGIVQIAYNFDKPVIATDVGGLSEVVLNGFTGFIVSPGKPGELAEAIRKFYYEEKEIFFSENVKKEKNKYTWDHFVNAIEMLVKKIK